MLHRPVSASRSDASRPALRSSKTLRLTPQKRFAKISSSMTNRLEPATRHYDEKLQQILKTSAKIFAEKGFHKTSVRDISRATRMSLAGLYYYFTTKEELLYLIQERCFLTLPQRWEQAATARTDVRTRPIVSPRRQRRPVDAGARSGSAGDTAASRPGSHPASGVGP